jgi:DNA repair protein RecN (Recombination protein N)
MDSLEADLQRAEHAEEIRSAMYNSSALLSGETTGILDQLKEVLIQLQKTTKFYTPSQELVKRLESVYIELKDLSAELDQQAEKTDIEPGKLEKLQERMDLLFSLMQKHRVRNLEELLTLREKLGQKIEQITFSDEKIGELEKKKSELWGELEHLSGILHLKRATAAEGMDRKVELQLRQMGIPNARFKVGIEKKEEFNQHGSDEIRFLFSANKQVPLEEISRVASGGEVSRLMLCIKSLVSGRKGMPTLIFDEIDAGVSGEIADKVGGIMDQLAMGRQVIAITHLPQVASRGSDQFTVFKEDTTDATYTRIRKLEPEERVNEIARMLSGEEVTDAALSNARVLLRV